MEYVLSGILVIVVVGVRVVISLASSSLRLQEYLFGTSWKKVEDCVEQGFSKKNVLGLLDLFYEKGILEVRLDPHVYTCDDYKMFILNTVAMETLDPSIDTEGIVKIQFREKDIPYDYFEANMFSHLTAHLFEFRIKREPPQRRWFKQKTGFKLPSFGLTKPAVQF